MFTFYILYSPSRDRYYLGYTSDQIQERLRRHNSKHKGFTGSQEDWQISFLEQYPDKISAYARERSVKSWKSRKKIEALIKSKMK
ncbi:MAG: GIY-YIG nuclease family protein [Bacteroidetes bacterium]|nr:GIY-YIG nuclease family protein [Bacteroidota bacterium]MBM3177555.1 GIY-YIG nuclease family protein [Bacteroidota bacterium]